MPSISPPGRPTHGRIAAAVLAAAEQPRTDLIVSLALATTDGGTDIGDKDLVAAVKSEDRHGAHVW